MLEKNPLKWTFRLLKIQQFFSFSLAGLIVVLVLLKSWPHTQGAIFMAAFSVGYAYFNFLVLKGLRSKHENSWNYAIITTSLSLPSLLFPLAFLSLKELFNNEAKKNYFKKPMTDGASESPLYNFPSLEPKRSTKTVVLICVTLSVFLIGYLNYDRLTGGSDFKVDKNLSAQQLYQIGAECNSKGNTKCSMAIFKRLLEINPSDMTALANLAMSQTQTGLHEEALKHYQTYFDLGGQGLDVMAYFAQSLNALGRQTEALKWYAQALSQHPNLIDVLENMVNILAAQGRYEEGAVLIDHFIEKNPSAENLLQSRRDSLMEKAKTLKETTI